MGGAQPPRPGAGDDARRGASAGLVTVTLVGPESTGKTTLAERLAHRFDAPWSGERARAYADERLAGGDGSPLGPADVEPIARGQMAGEDAAADAARRRGSRLVVRDTDLVSTIVYARHYYGAVPPWVEHAARARRAELYLLCDVDAPWVADTVRDPAGVTPAAREALRDAFVATLGELGCRWAPLRGAWDVRWRDAERRTAALLDR